MTDRDALLAAVLARPEDDVPRLVYADWLEERAGAVECAECSGRGYAYYEGSHGRPYRDTCSCSGTGRVGNGFAARAEFIRVQCELAGLPLCESPIDTGKFLGFPMQTHCDECRACTLRRREGELLSAVQDAVRDEWRGDGDVWWEAWDFRRGFVEQITCTAAAWLAHGDAVLEAHPVRAVRLTTWPTGVIGVTADMPCEEYGGRWPGITFELPPEGYRGRVVTITREMIFGDTTGR